MSEFTSVGGEQQMVEIERLDRRAHLSTTKLIDAGGLPRQLTAVGDVVYFAVDSKADGHLSYVDLAGYNVKTKSRISVRRADGTKFGNVEYTLKSVDNRLRITELLGKGKTAEWSLKNGDSKAKKYAAPKPPVSKDLATGFNATRVTWTNRQAFASNNAIYTFDPVSKKVRSVPVPFEKHLARIDGVSVVGNQLIVAATHKEGTKLYVVDRKSGVAGRFRVSRDAGDSSVMTTLPAGALVQATVHKTPQLFLTDGTIAGTRALPAYPGVLSTSAEYVQADEHTIYFSNHTAIATPADPERAGPYVAPGSSAGSVTTIGGVAAGGPYDYGVYKLDLAANAVTRVGGDTFDRGFQQVGDRLYFLSGYTDQASNYPPLATLNVIDLPSGLVSYVAPAFEKPVYANGKAIVIDSAAAASIATAQPDVGTLKVAVYHDDARATSFANAARVTAVDFFLDLNHDGSRQKSEPVSYASHPNDTFAYLKPGDYEVRVIQNRNWTATRGWTQTVKVSAGALTTVEFGLADDLKSGIVRGYAYSTLARPTAWLDLDDDGIRDAGEPSATQAAGESFAFGGLASGTYHVRVDGNDSRYHATIEFPGEDPTVTWI